MARLAFIIGEMADADRADCLGCGPSFWPDETIAACAAEIDEWDKGATAWGVVAELHGGFPVAFAEVALRPDDNGCDSRPPVEAI